MYINSFELFGRITPLLMTADVYKNEPFADLATRFLLAIGNNKLRVYFGESGTEVLGFISWCYHTDEEVATGQWSWSEVFARDTGDQLWIVDMAATHSVLSVVRDFRRFIHEREPGVKAHWRRDRNGRRLQYATAWSAK